MASHTTFASTASRAARCVLQTLHVGERRRRPWLMCLAAATFGAAGIYSHDTKLESDRRSIGFGAHGRTMMHRLTQQQQQAALLAKNDLEPSRFLPPVHKWGSALPPLPQYHQKSTKLITKNIQSDYELLEVIGEGGFGLVHIGRHRASNTPVAIKRVCKQRTSKEKFLQEVAILNHVSSNDSVLHVTEAFETKDAYVLVTELVSGGELYDYLVTRGVFKEHRAQVLTREITTALAHLHTQRVVHADIKLENILLSDNEESSSVCLIDFGLAFREDHVGERACAVSSGVGTTAYAAPEYIQKQTCGSAIDMWAFGVVLYVMLCGRHPFDPTDNASDDEMKVRILAGDFDRDSSEWKRLSAGARDLIQQLLVVDPQARITASEVLQHKWVQCA
ncbi:Camk protein kinase, partial [Globisporangium splendens]